MDWYRLRPAQLLADVRIHSLSLEAQGLLVQLTAICAQYDGALSLTALVDDVRPALAGRRREALLAELSPILAAYLEDVETQASAYAAKSDKARAAAHQRHGTRPKPANASANARANASADAAANEHANAHAEREREREIPPTPHEGDGFERFWEAYPKKAAKAKALAAWRKLTPDAALVGDMLAALVWQRASSQWVRDDGQYVPLPASWLNGRRWEDARETSTLVDSVPVPDWEVA